MADWPHAPLHRFNESGVFFVTGATYLKQHFYRRGDCLDRFQSRLFDLAEKHGCNLEAWCLLSNHYHLVSREGDLHKMLSQLHSLEAIDQNRADGVTGRKVWFQFWETELTFERSWMARLKYTHENAVHHRVVRIAERYRWCSASWFARTAPKPFADTLKRFGISRISVRDDFGALPAEE
jgi:putative transposase